MNRICFLLLTIVLAASATAHDTTIYLVRHAEKTDGPDPELTNRGQHRADHIYHILRDAGIDAVHSTDTRRTRLTAAPMAEHAGVEVELYDPADLAEFASNLKTAGGTHLVVGHSNTTPNLVQMLGGVASPMGEDEYDRLYLMTFRSGEVETILLRSVPYVE